MKRLHKLLIILLALICCALIPEGAQAASGKPVISNTKKTITLYSGETLSVKVNASGSGLKYKWTYSKDGGKTWLNVLASQRTKSTYTEKVKTTMDGYKYRCTVTNSKGSASYTFTLKVKSPVLSPTKQTTVTIHKKEQATLYVVAQNAKSYQWQYLTTKNKWADIKGATKSSYTVTPGLRVQYRCRVNNGVETVASPAFVLKEEKELIVAVGKTLTLKVDDSNTKLKYKWQYKKAGATSWSTIKGATKASYTTAKLRLSNYMDQYRCVVSTSKGKLYTTEMTLQAGKKLTFQVADIMYNASGGTNDTLIVSGYIGDPVPSRQSTLKMYSGIYPVSDMIRLVRGKSDSLYYTIWGYTENFERKMVVEAMN